ncbi:protein transport protein Sec24A [Danaus plexippus]|uniref:protein transport protein Sec24A n=1 Tax=Danaus plexippus TaxID=13037 RepID=UPI002AAF8B2F|nr:protein transport protein Sec24A [Danaus plexippus]
MSHIPNPYNNAPGTYNSNPAMFQQFNQTLTRQLPPKQDTKPIIPTSIQGFNHQTNPYNDESASSSPAFNNTGMMPLPTSLQSSPMRPVKPVPSQQQAQSIQNIPLSSSSPHSMTNTNQSNSPYHPQYHQINNNAPPLIPSSLNNQPNMNGPMSAPNALPNQYPAASNSFSPAPMNRPPTINTFSTNQSYRTNHTSQTSSPHAVNHQPNVPFNGPSGPRNSPLTTGQQVNSLTSSMAKLPPISGPPGPPRSQNSLINGPMQGQAPLNNMGPPKNMSHGPSSLPIGQPGVPLRPTGQTNQQPPLINSSQPNFITGPPSGPQSMPIGPGQAPPMVQQPRPGPASGPSSMTSRYPQMPYTNLSPQQQMQVQQNIAKQFPTHNLYDVNQQGGQLSVTKQGFNQLWGHQMVDLMQCKHILPEYPEDPPEIRLGQQFAEANNCSPEIFRCTVNRIPETNSLLQKSRLPLGILIHPFKDLNHLPVIQCTTIVRCRACRTYINPFVHFVDSKRWKCNLCYRVNELPEEFQYDPVSKSYGDPSRRPEVKSATIEFIAPSEYMLRPPQPAVYLFLFDVSQNARESGYLQVVCDTLKSNLEQLPGDARTQVGFICYDEHIHYYLMSDGLSKPREMTVLDVEEVFLPSPESLLVNLLEHRAIVVELLSVLPRRYSSPTAPASALGPALQAAYKLMAPTGGRVTVFQTCLPNVGPGALESREDPNARSAQDVRHLSPATDFYKRLALDCSGVQVAVDLFLLSSQYCDLATISGMSKFSAGTVHHIPLFRASRQWQAELLTRMLCRYLTRKIGFEAVMRVRCTRGISIHTFHGNFFVRSTDLLSLANVSPDAGFAMQLSIDESLTELQHVCFQAALLYTSSKGERRIRVHTLSLPVASTLPDVLHSADQHAVIGLLAKMAVDRCVSASMSEAKEALMNAAVDMLSAHRLAHSLPTGDQSASLHAPTTLRLLPLLILALLKRKAFRTGTSTRLDERVSDMLFLKTAPLASLLRAVHPDLYELHTLSSQHQPPRLQLSAERLSLDGAYLLDEGETMVIYVCRGVSAAWLSEALGVNSFAELPAEGRDLPHLDTGLNDLLHGFIDRLNEDRPYAAGLLLLRDDSPSRQLFTERLVEDRVESAFSYYEFLQHLKSQVK